MCKQYRLFVVRKCHLWVCGARLGDPRLLRLPLQIKKPSPVGRVGRGFSYSYLIASIGSSCAAFLAGYQPKKTPVKVQTAKLMMMLHGCM